MFDTCNKSWWNEKTIFKTRRLKCMAEGPDSDRFGTDKCEHYKKKGYCSYPSYKYFKCQKTCSICEVNGNWGNWGSWSHCSNSCGGGRQGRKRECDNPRPAYGGQGCSGTSENSRDCNTNKCPVDGNWGEWSQWSTCTKSCKQGKQSRTRKCNSPEAKYGGKACTGDGEETRVCNKDVPCPVNGNWGQWGQWSMCTKTCKEGKQSRKRECNSPAPQYGGKACEGESIGVRICNANVPCPVDGNWGGWSEWSTCTKTCKQGKQSRTRKCNSPAAQYGGRKCDGESSQTQICNQKVPCPVDGSWGAWSEWSTCTKTCKQGKQSRTRECNSPAPQYGGKNCDGDRKESQVCNEKIPCPVSVDGNWGEWGEWSTCTKTCKQGEQSRSRKCNLPTPQYGGRKCDGEGKESQVCNDKVPCPVDGNWGAWSEWSTCTKTCKQGKQSRTRECNSPAPLYGGKKCDGEGKETQVCNDKVPCPVDGNWGEWSVWSTCTKTCKQGKQSRSRQCNSPAPKYGGKNCDGEGKETQVCNDKSPCPVDGNWGEWSEWSTCTKTCKQGKQSRTRKCDNPAPQYGGRKCEGEADENQICNDKTPCPVDGNWGEWGAWTKCSKSCGGGEHSRKRLCDSPAPAHGGKICEGAFRQRRPCNENNCPVDGSWGSWAPWSACSATCGYGNRQRKRVCDNPKPAYNGKSCVGVGYQKARCHAYYPCPVDGNWTSWGAWTSCTKTCGLSYRKRSRSCANPPPQYGGSGCVGLNDQVERCKDKPCPGY
ncbi:A disintegrin and metalloproteinase with thrombospondin motifs adt-1-like [Stylophora pistillata]|uniref:A disintegrin and metalloproteinase with thrombospondin motifs adt-1-like n=1 Tax=Stylophora pistillata TaxID=50429 RepID=UPI000C042936|nr:A disintegrin and metalloproteinase with thrombospondin motifs adt-1-like [Stylophora pistillata]